MANSKFLSKAAEEALVQFTAVNGENYGMYVHFAEQQSWRVFSKSYHHKWCFKPRIHRRIALARDGVRETLKEWLLSDKAARIEMLESDIERIDQFLDAERDERHPMTAGEMIRLMDQRRKNLEAIARETGDWNQKGKKGEAPEAIGDFFKNILVQRSLNAPAEDESPPVEGEFVEVEDEGSAEPEAEAADSGQIMNDDGTPYA